MRTIKYIFSIILLAAFAGLNAQSGLSPRVLDYQMEYFWDEISGLWDPAGTTTNTNRIEPVTDEQGRIIELITYNYLTNENVRRTLIEYNASGRRISEIYQIWSTGSWVNDRHDSYNYDGAGLTIEMIRQFWVSNSWVNYSRRHLYEYNAESRMTHYSQQVWVNGLWIDDSEEYWSYNGNRLSERINILSNGTNRYRYTYSYDDLTLTYDFNFQIWSNNSWVNRTYRVSYYNNCGYSFREILLQWRNEVWNNYRKINYFFTVNNNLDTIPMCHNGNTMLLLPSETQIHLSHGDCIGICITDVKLPKDKEKKPKKSLSISDYPDDILSEMVLLDINNYDLEKSIQGDLFKRGKSERISPEKGTIIRIYPNPVKGNSATLTISGNQENTIVNLVDITGRRLRSYVVDEQNSLEIDLSGLKKGTYFLTSENGRSYERFIII